MAVERSARIKPRLAYLVTEDWYFLSHRLPMAQAAKAAGYEVHVITNVGSHGHAIADLGFELHPMRWRRGSMNPVDLAAMIRAIRGRYRRIAPDLVHHVALEPTIVGSLAALGLPMIWLNAVTGWGFAFTSAKPRARARTRRDRVAVAPTARSPRAASRWSRMPTTARRWQDSACPVERIFLIAGSGVDVDAAAPALRAGAGRSPSASSAVSSKARGCEPWLPPMICSRAAAVRCGC